MTKDVSDMSIVWNPVAERWYWSNPASAYSAGTLVTGVSTNDPANVDTTPANFNYANVEDITMVAADISLIYDARLNGGAGAWDWNMPLKDADFVNEAFTFLPTNNPVLSIISASSGEGQGAMATADAAGVATTVSLSWDGTAWAASAGGGTTGFAIDTALSSNTQIQLQVWETTNTASTSVIRYTFGSALTTAAGQSIAFQIDPSPPLEYPNAVIATNGSYATGITIDFDADLSNDLEFNVTAGGGAIGANDSFRFTTNPNRIPFEYPDATLKGDQTEAVIDLDGSGNEADKRDIVFSFTDPLKYGTSTHPFTDRSVISFDIKGSTAWSEISKDETKKTGYYEFTVDFLGGEFGSTETDIKLDIGTKYDGINFVNDSLSSTQYAKSSSTVFQDADGYSAGDLQGVDVASDGILTGIYSNGQLIPLFRIGLAKFLNNYGLSSEGGNLFRETRASGGAITNKPGENGLGTLAPNSLEMSNVDISEEFVAMIVQQRGFQANSKTITTVDDMMQTVINMKR
jgi:flagellar hook protein FlgE